MKTKAKDEIKDAILGYTANVDDLDAENRILRETVTHLKDELSKFQKNPLIIAEVKDVLDNGVVLKLTNGNEFLVDVSPGCTEKIHPGDFVLAEQKNLTIIRKIPSSKSFNVERYVIIEKPDTKFTDIGGLE